MNSVDVNNKTIRGYRGYIGSRCYSGIDFPQNIQNFLIRSYCQKHQLHYLLSGTEYRMPGCYMILEEILSNIYSVDGIVFFSIFMLPESAIRRKCIYETILNSGCTFHAALEDIAVQNDDDVQALEDILRLNQIVLTDASLPDLREFYYTKNEAADQIA